MEGFRYRVEDVLRAVTKAAVTEARLKEVKLEMINSVKLKAHFEDNPRELDLLKHDKVLRPSKIKKYLEYVPKYLIPPSLQQQVCPDQHVHRPRHPMKHSMKRPMKRPMKRSLKGPRHAVEDSYKKRNAISGTLSQKKRKFLADPLKSFQYNSY